MEVEWRKRTDFAPFAEALGIDTDWIMSAAGGKGQGTWLVLYSDPATEDPGTWIMLGVLEPDADGILIATRRSRFKTVAEFNKGLREHMEALEGRE
jgi:hypothetical protein